MTQALIYQILVDPSKAALLDPGFTVLDNSSNQRPDWYEYWPIRKFLLSETLDEDCYYGFLSPKFKEKTNLSAAAVRTSVEQASADVILMSPSLHWTAYHWNVFEFGEAVHPGLMEAATRFFQRIGEDTDLVNLCTDSRNEVYSNYLIAKPAFWRAWLMVTEQLFAMAESDTDELGARLREPTHYRGSQGVQMKIFLMERIATWLLLRRPDFTVRARDPFATRARIYKLPGAIVCDALKIAHTANPGKPQYRDVFALVSRMGRLLSWQIKFANAVGVAPVRTCLAALSSYWARAGSWR